MDRRLACVLALVAGAVNTMAFRSAGFFLANMTGNVSSLSDRLARGQWVSGLFFLSIVASFILGASVSTLLINAGRRRNIRSIYAIGILAEAVLMVLLGLVELSFGAPQHGALLVLGLSFLMGLQNAVITLISNARVRSTHVSGMSTDIGIGMGMLIDIVRGRDTPAASGAHRDKLALHVPAVLAFLLGGVLGVAVYDSIGIALLFVAATVLAAMAGSAILRAGRCQSDTA
jgi:uncharacterized membrane protein YoaK (UPF0700 family)